MVRCMPNTPVVVRSGVTVYSSNGSVGEEDKELVEHMLDSVGLGVEMPEHYMDNITGLTGCGPSYVSTRIHIGIIIHERCIILKVETLETSTAESLKDNWGSNPGPSDY